VNSEDFDDYPQFMLRLEALVRLFVGGQFETATELWRIQTDLLDLQTKASQARIELRSSHDEACRDEQELIRNKPTGWLAEVREVQAVQKSLRQQIEQMGDMLAKARSFGDAYAWTLMGNQSERLIRPLSQNAPVKSVPDFDARMGVLLVAQEWANNGAGFPLLHDVTNILRIGDITFVDDQQNVTTVEIKTRYEGEGDEADVHHYSVGVWGTKPLVEPSHHEPLYSLNEQAEGQSPSPSVRTFANPRLLRQLERMRIAELTQKADPGRVHSIKEYKLLPIEWRRSDSMTHWNAVRDLATKSKVNEPACAALDDALFCAAIRSDPPMHSRSNMNAIEGCFGTVSSRLASSGIFTLTLTLIRIRSGLASHSRMIKTLSLSITSHSSSIL
jgi:hypothetical protein